MDLDIDSFMTKINTLYERTSRLIDSKCSLCDSVFEVEMHHLRHIRKSGTAIKGDLYTDNMSKLNKKQIPLCKTCYAKVHAHAGKYDGLTLNNINYKSHSWYNTWKRPK